MITDPMIRDMHEEEFKRRRDMAISARIVDWDADDIVRNHEDVKAARAQARERGLRRQGWKRVTIGIRGQHRAVATYAKEGVDREIEITYQTA